MNLSYDDWNKNALYQVGMDITESLDFSSCAIASNGSDFSKELIESMIFFHQSMIDFVPDGKFESCPRHFIEVHLNLIASLSLNFHLFTEKNNFNLKINSAI